MKRKFLAPLVVLAFVIVSAAAARSQTQTVYNSIPKPLPGNVASEGPEAYAFAELGDGFTLLNSAGGTLGQVKIVMSSWACQTGHWYDGTCVTSPGATFSQPLTIKVYAVDGSNNPAGLLSSTTQTFDVPYRPSSTPTKCEPTAWFNAKDKTCYHGIAVPVIVNFADQHVVIPQNSKIIVTVSFNTSHFGPNPIGETACNTASGGCPYDSLNIATDGNGAIDGDGSVLDANGIFVNYTSSATACPGNTTTGVLALDPGCWTGYHPQIHVQVNTNTKPGSKGNAP